MSDVFNSFATGIGSVILLVMIYFFLKKYFNYRLGDKSRRRYSFWSHLIRAPLPIIIIGLPLLISLSWTFGITWAVLGTLNTMTSVLFVILFGLGIDYGIHFYARYIEFRSDGGGVQESIRIDSWTPPPSTKLDVAGIEVDSIVDTQPDKDDVGAVCHPFRAGYRLWNPLLCPLHRVSFRRRRRPGVDP